MGNVLSAITSGMSPPNTASELENTTKKTTTTYQIRSRRINK